MPRRRSCWIWPDGDAGPRQLSILDLGCGTGLAGAAFKPLAARLDGVDLSPAMIEKAARAESTISRVADLETALGRRARL